MFQNLNNLKHKVLKTKTMSNTIIQLYNKTITSQVINNIVKIMKSTYIKMGGNGIMNISINTVS